MTDERLQSLYLSKGQCSEDNDEMNRFEPKSESERKKRRKKDKQKKNQSHNQKSPNPMIVSGYNVHPPFGEELITPACSQNDESKMQFKSRSHPFIITRTTAEQTPTSENTIFSSPPPPPPPSSWHERDSFEKSTINLADPIEEVFLLSTNERKKANCTTTAKRGFQSPNLMPFTHPSQNHHSSIHSTFFPYAIPIPTRLPTPPPLPPLYSDLRKRYRIAIMPPTKKSSQTPTIIEQQTSITNNKRSGRGRIAVACDPCRAFKRKCSGEQPCELCKRRGRSHECKYEPGPCSLPRTTQTIESGPSSTAAGRMQRVHSSQSRKDLSNLPTREETETEKEKEEETSDSDFEFEEDQQKELTSDQIFSHHPMVQWNNTFHQSLPQQTFAPPPLPPIENQYENRFRSRSFSHPYAYPRNVLPLPRLTVVEPVQNAQIRHRRSYSLHTPPTRGETSESGGGRE